MHANAHRRCLTAVLTVAALLAVAAGAAASTTESAAYGQRVDLTVVGVFGGVSEIDSGPAPLVSGTAPPTYLLEEETASTQVNAPLGLGTLLATGSIEVEASSAAPDLEDAAASASASAVQLDLAGLLTLNAGTMSANAEVLPEDGESCWSGTMGSGGATFESASLGGALVPVRIQIPASPAPNTVLLDLPGVARVILNEQVIEDGRVSVHAVHVRLDNLTVLGIGTLRGDVYLAHADAVVACGGADVAVSIVESHDPGAVGAQMTYTATVGNFGPERAVDALLSVPLSIAVSPVSAVPSQGSCTIVGRNVTCALGDVRFGETATVILTVTPLHSGAVAVHADVAAANQDVFPENNHGCEMTSVLGAATIKTADLRVEVEDSADPIQVGQLLTYTVTVTHDGGVPVTSALASLELPFGMFLQSVSPSQGSCSGDRIIICNTGSMAAGQQMTVSVTVWVLRGGALEASAIVSSGVTDPQVGDNSFDEITQAEDPPA